MMMDVNDDQEIIDAESTASTSSSNEEEPTTTMMTALEDCNELKRSEEAAAEAVIIEEKRCHLIWELRQLLEDKKQSDKRNVNRYRTKTSEDAIKCYKCLESILDDCESLISFQSNQPIKSIVFDALVQIIQASMSDDFLKMAFALLKRFLDIEYDVTRQQFIDNDPNSIMIYSSAFQRVIPHLNDIMLEESFFTDDEDQSEFQDDLLWLLFYLFKTISVRKLVMLGFRPRHLQFIIIHFTTNKLIPMVNIINIFFSFGSI